MTSLSEFVNHVDQPSLRYWVCEWDDNWNGRPHHFTVVCDTQSVESWTLFQARRNGPEPADYIHVCGPLDKIVAQVAAFCDNWSTATRVTSAFYRLPLALETAFLSMTVLDLSYSEETLTKLWGQACEKLHDTRLGGRPAGLTLADLNNNQNN